MKDYTDSSPSTSRNRPFAGVLPLDGHKLEDPFPGFRIRLDLSGFRIPGPPGDDRIGRVVRPVPAQHASAVKAGSAADVQRPTVENLQSPKESC